MILIGLGLGAAGVLILFVAATIDVSSETRHYGRHRDNGLDLLGAPRAPAHDLPAAPRGRLYASTGQYAGAHR